MRQLLGVFFSSWGYIFFRSMFFIYALCIMFFHIFFLHLAMEAVLFHSDQTISFHPTYSKQGYLCPDLLIFSDRNLAVTIGSRSWANVPLVTPPCSSCIPFPWQCCLPQVVICFMTSEGNNFRSNSIPYPP